MEWISALIDFILHIDVHLAALTLQYGMWTYAILFLIVFAETGLVVTPFLPGDSLLFAAGALCALGTLDITTLILLLIVAAIIGDALNYSIGKGLGHRLISHKSRIIKPEYLQRTHDFYEKHGGRTIIFARFVPIVRTFAPFVAGLGEMGYRKFALYNIVGGIVWVVSFCVLGYFFGQTPIIKKNFTLVIFGIIFISILPAIVEIIRTKRSKL